MSPRDIFLVRHGRAAESAPGGDPARPLTPEGRDGIAGVGRALASFGVVPDAIWHSPYVRATETAALLAKELGGQKLVPDGVLAPTSSAERASQAIVQAPSRTLVVVSHMPLLPELAYELVGARVDFGTGTVAHIALLGPHGAVLLGLWTADQLGRVR